MDENTLAGSVIVTGSMIESMRSTKPWTMLISILGFVMVGFMVLFGAGFTFFAGMFMPQQQSAPASIMGVLYILLSAVYFVPALYLYRYSSAIARFLANNGANDLESALAHQKSFWKFSGIMTLISIVVGVLAIGAAILIPLLMKITRQSV